MKNSAQELIQLVTELSKAKDLQQIMHIVAAGARRLVGSDGATFVLKDGEMCFYLHEDALSPLWKGQRFPLESCISGWCMVHKEAVVVENIYADSRIPAEAYRPTFVKSLAMVPIRKNEPLGAIGNYWAKKYRASEEELELLQALADATSVALTNIELYNQLNNQVTAMHEAHRLKDEFLMTLSHELRTPLSSILGWSYTLLADQNAWKTGLRAIQSNAQKQLNLINDLLDTGKVLAKQMTFQKKVVDFSQLVQSLVEDYRHLALEKNIELTTSFLQQEKMVIADVNRIEQVMTIMLDNAIKFTPMEGEIQVSFKLVEGYACFEVKDSGPGFSLEVQKKMFQPFIQADSSSTRSFEGLGLGLFIAQHIVHEHGGHLQSNGDKGATFRLLLPVAVVTNLVESMQPKIDLSMIRTENSEFKDMRILLIDDCPDVLELLQNIFSRLGAKVQTCLNAIEGHIQLNRFLPHLLICDLAMPEENGHSLLKKIRSEGHKLPSIALSAYDDPAKASEALESGFNIFLLKPVDPSLLKQKVLELFNLTYNQG